MTELKEEHFEVIDANKDRERQKSKYKPLPYDMFIEESMINGQGLFASTDIPKGTDLGVCHIQIEIDKMSPTELIRTPLGGFINHSDNPNCYISTDRGDRTLHTVIPVEAGTELTVYYRFKGYDGSIDNADPDSYPDIEE